MFTLQKLAVLIAIIGAVWYAFRLADRLQAARRAAVRRTGPGDHARQVAGQTLLPCPACGTYLARGSAGPCGRPDCPQG
jgi:hypothetical protein